MIAFEHSGLIYCFFFCSFQVIGPKLMENRKPFNLRYILILYNFIQVIFSAWLFYEVSDTFLSFIQFFFISIKHFQID